MPARRRLQGVHAEPCFKCAYLNKAYRDELSILVLYVRPVQQATQPVRASGHTHMDGACEIGRTCAISAPCLVAPCTI